MSGMIASYELGSTACNTATKALLAFNAPTNQKVRVSFNIFSLDPTGAAMVQVEIRRRGTDDGTKSAAVTWVKSNGQDAETVQSALYTYSVQPTNDGSVVWKGWVTSQRNAPFPEIIVNGGEKYTVFATTTQSQNLAGEVRINE